MNNALGAPDLQDSLDWKQTGWSYAGNVKIPIWLWTVAGAFFLAVVTMALLTGVNKSIVLVAGGMIGLLVFVTRPAFLIFAPLALYPLDQSLDTIGFRGVSPGRYLPVLSLLLGVFLLQRPFRMMRHSTFFMGWIILFGYSMLLLVFAASVPNAITYLAGAGLLWFYYEVVARLFGQMDFVRPICLWLFGTSVLASIVIMRFGQTAFAMYIGRTVVEGLGINAPATVYGFVMILGLYPIIARDKWAARWPVYMPFYVVGCLILWLFIFRAATRAVVLTVPLSVILAAMIIYWNRASRWLMVSILLVLVFLALLWVIQSGMIESSSIDRSLSLVTKSGEFSGNVRWIIWKQGIGIFMSNPMGVGAGNEAIAFMGKGTAGESHNLFVSALVQMGLVGLFVMLSFMIWFFIQIRKIAHLPLRFITMSIFFYWFMNNMKISVFQTRVFWYPALVILILCIAGREKGLIVNSAEQEFLASEGDPLSDHSRL